jgi:UDP-2,3-diacylglucosamine pyrophosphatase LpxH
MLERAKIKTIYTQLDQLYESSVKEELKKNKKFVVFSDLHMGDGSAKDDFRQNAQLFRSALEEYYFSNAFNLILNGDIEELQRFSLKSIHKRWKEIYDVFDKFHAKGMLFKLIGNHDLTLLFEPEQDIKYPVLHSLTLQSKDGEMLIFHGHQASMLYKNLNKLLGYTLKYLANPLRIRNYSISHNSRKQYKIEQRVYHYSNFRKRVSIIGHTHRPLFESLSKAERLKYKVEELCRIYMLTENDSVKKPIKKQIKSHKKELRKLVAKDKKVLFESQIYNSVLHIPCLFNSGCVIGKRGMTCLEIDKNEIALVHWFDKKTSKKYLDKHGYNPHQIENTDYFRMVLNKEQLRYVFSRINLLA